MPYNIYFSRVILPEPMAISLGLLGLYFFVKFIDKESSKILVLSAILFSLSLLVKPFTIFYLIPAGFLLVQKYGLEGISRKSRVFIPLILFSLITLALPELSKFGNNHA